MLDRSLADWIRRLWWTFENQFYSAMVCFLFGIATALSCAAQSEARIRIVIPSIEQPESDLKWLIELAPDPNLKKQWKKLKGDIIDAFIQGVDPSKPSEINLVFRKSELSYEYYLTYANEKDLKDLVASIEGMGFKFTGVTKQNPVVENKQFEFREKNQGILFF